MSDENSSITANLDKAPKPIRKRDAKLLSKTNKSVDEENTMIRILSTQGQLSLDKQESEVLKMSLLNLYSMETQRVVLQAKLRDPTKNESSTNRTYIKGQTILLFNRNKNPSDLFSRKRLLSLEVHSKDLIINKISLAKRYKKVDENGKILSYVHDRTKDVKFQSNLDPVEKLREDISYKPEFQNSSVDEKENIENAFEVRPFIQNFEDMVSMRFKQEKEKGLILIENVLELENEQEFPSECDIIIDFEVPDVFSCGLAYRKTIEPTGYG